MRRYRGFEVNHDDFTLRCLAYESLRLVQDSGNNVYHAKKVDTVQRKTCTSLCGYRQSLFVS